MIYADRRSTTHSMGKTLIDLFDFPSYNTASINYCRWRVEAIENSFLFASFYRDVTYLIQSASCASLVNKASSTLSKENRYRAGENET